MDWWALDASAFLISAQLNIFGPVSFGPVSCLSHAGLQEPGKVGSHLTSPIPIKKRVRPPLDACRIATRSNQTGAAESPLQTGQSHHPRSQVHRQRGAVRANNRTIPEPINPQVLG